MPYGTTDERLGQDCMEALALLIADAQDTLVEIPTWIQGGTAAYRAGLR